MKPAGFRSKLTVFMAAFLSMTSVVTAQFTSSVQGAVADSSGAVIPEVQLTLTNVGTGVTIETRSNESGIYRFPDLPPGRYRLRATKTGFQTLLQENILLESGRVQAVSLTMNVGAISQEVTVTAAAVQVETTNPKISTVW